MEKATYRVRCKTILSAPVQSLVERGFPWCATVLGPWLHSDPRTGQLEWNRRVVRESVRRDSAIPKLNLDGSPHACAQRWTGYIWLLARRLRAALFCARWAGKGPADRQTDSIAAVSSMIEDFV